MDPLTKVNHCIESINEILGPEPDVVEVIVITTYLLSYGSQRRPRASTQLIIGKIEDDTATVSPAILDAALEVIKLRAVRKLHRMAAGA